MNPIVSEFFSTIIKELAKQVADQIKGHTGGTAAPAAEDVGKAETKKKTTKKADQTKVEVAVEKPAEEWRADCLAIINELAPTHGRQIRALFTALGVKRLPEVPAEALPALLTDLAGLQDAR